MTGRASPHPVRRWRKFRIGTVWRVSFCSGLASGRRVTVIAPFDWRAAEDGTYRPPGPHEIPVRYPDGRRGFMFQNRLSPLV